MKPQKQTYEIAAIEFEEITTKRLPGKTYSEVQDDIIEKVYDCEVYKIHVVKFKIDLFKSEYNKIKALDTNTWDDDKFRKYLRIQKPSSDYQMIPDFGYPRELCISVFRTKIQTDVVWMKRALQILAAQFTSKEKDKYRSIDRNNAGANRVDSPRVIYCWRNINNLSENDVKYLKVVLPKYAAQIIKYSDEKKLKKFFDKYFNEPVPF